MTKAYLREAIRRIKTVERALEERGYAYCIRQSREAVELALKGSLRLVCIEPPKWHDVGPILLRERDRFPEWFKQKLEEMASIQDSLDVRESQVCTEMRRLDCHLMSYTRETTRRRHLKRLNGL